MRNGKSLGFLGNTAKIVLVVKLLFSFYFNVEEKGAFIGWRTWKHPYN